MELKDYLLIVLPLATAIISIVLTKNKDIAIKIREEKIKRYEKMISYLKRGFMGSTLPDVEKLKNKMLYYEETYVVWLYASDDVIKFINKFAVEFSKYSKNQTPENDKAVHSCVGELLIAMRKDTRGRTNLNFTDFISTQVYP